MTSVTGRDLVAQPAGARTGAGEALPDVADQVGELLGALHLELGADVREQHHRPLEPVHGHGDPTRGGVDRLDVSPLHDVSSHARRVRPDLDAHVVLPGDGGPARPDVVQRVPAGQVTLAEPDPGALRLGDPVEPEGAPVVAVEVVGDEVPPMVEGHESLWLDVPPGQVAAAGGVPEPQAFVVAAGLRDLRQGAGVDHGTARRASDGLAAERVHPAPQLGRHDRHDLGQRLDRALLEPGHRATGRSTEPDRDRDRLVVVQQERRQGGAGL